MLWSRKLNILYYIFCHIVKHVVEISQDFLKGEKILKNKYVQNVYAMLLRRGLAPKYAHPGIYCIKVND